MRVQAHQERKRKTKLALQLLVQFLVHLLEQLQTQPLLQNLVQLMILMNLLLMLTLKIFLWRKFTTPNQLFIELCSPYLDYMDFFRCEVFIDTCIFNTVQMQYTMNELYLHLIAEKKIFSIGQENSILNNQIQKFYKYRVIAFVKLVIAL